MPPSPNQVCYSLTVSSSFVEFKEKGFWCWDGHLDPTLRMLGEEVDAKSSPYWLLEARARWLIQASVWGGVIDPDLDAFLRNENCVQLFLALIDRVLARTDLSIEVRQTLEMLAALVRGEIETTASSPLDYMVSVRQPDVPSGGPA